VKDWDDLGNRIYGKKSGQEVAVEVRRGSEEVTLRVKIGRRVVQP
jgi:S1-C subfamily serine protease